MGGISGKIIRVGVSSGGPLLLAVANFMVSMVALPVMSAADFGTLAFVMALSQFAVGVGNGLVSSPMTVETQYDTGLHVRTAFMSAAVVYAVLAGIAVGVASFLASGSAEAGLWFGVFGAFLVLRAVDRAVFAAQESPYRAFAVDLSYFATTIAGVAWIAVSGSIDVVDVSYVLAASAGVAVLAASPDLTLEKILAVGPAAVRRYAGYWGGSVGWAALGAVAVDLTLNAQVYVVTLALGSAAYAPLAVAALAWRPFVVVLFSVCGFEQGRLSRRLAAGDRAGAMAIVRTLLCVDAVVWAGTFAAGAAVVWFGLDALGRSEYHREDIMPLFLTFAAIMAVRAVRQPYAAAATAARRFKETTTGACMSAAIGVALVYVLATAFGAGASLLGILAGDVLLLAWILSIQSGPGIATPGIVPAE